LTNIIITSIQLLQTAMAGSDVHVHPDDVKVIPFTPITSLARELGILFAFLGLCIVTMALYWFIWQGMSLSLSSRHTAIPSC
jgi:hypothetical protein